MAPKRVISPSSTDFCSPSSLTTSARLSSLPNSLHTVTKRQPIVRIVQVRPPTIIQADLASFRDIVLQYTGHHAALSCRQEEANVQDEEKVNIPRSNACSDAAASPSSSYAASTVSSSSSSSSSDSLGDNPGTDKISNTQMADSSSEHVHQDYGCLFDALLDIGSGYDGFSQLHMDEYPLPSSKGMQGMICAWDSVPAFDRIPSSNQLEFHLPML